MITLALILFTSSVFAAEPCGDRLRAYTVYEVMEEGEIQEQTSVFPIDDWSDASAFDGILTPEPTKASLEIVLRQKKKRVVKRFDFATWSYDSSFAHAKDFDSEKFFENSESGDSFTLRLKEDGKTICEERREIWGD